MILKKTNLEFKSYKNKIAESVNFLVGKVLRKMNFWNY